MDHMCDSLGFVGSGNVEWLHDGWIRSYSAGHRYRRISCPTFSGTKRIVAIWTLAGESKGIWKGGGQQVQKDLPNLTIPSEKRSGHKPFHQQIHRKD